LAQGTALSPRCALRVACGALQRLASLHRLGYAHNDVSTSNLCAGAGGGAAQHEIHLVDFGSATPLPSSSTTAAGGDRERRDTDGGGGGGTPLFASAAAHGGGLCGAADDLESLAYVLSFLARGSLPWEHAPPADIPAAKRAATASQLSEGLPREAAVAVEALLRPPRGAGGEVPLTPRHRRDAAEKEISVPRQPSRPERLTRGGGPSGGPCRAAPHAAPCGRQRWWRGGRGRAGRGHGLAAPRAELEGRRGDP